MILFTPKYEGHTFETTESGDMLIRHRSELPWSIPMEIFAASICALVAHVQFLIGGLESFWYFYSQTPFGPVLFLSELWFLYALASTVSSVRIGERSVVIRNCLGRTLVLSPQEALSRAVVRRRREASYKRLGRYPTYWHVEWRAGWFRRHLLLPERHCPVPEAQRIEGVAMGDEAIGRILAWLQVPDPVAAPQADSESSTR